MTRLLHREGDYYRYGAETSDGDQKEQYKNKADQAYTAAQTAATQTSGNASDETNNEDPLKPTNPILLGLGLNQSVFNYEILQKEQEAKDLAQKHFNDALDQLDALDEVFPTLIGASHLHLSMLPTSGRLQGCDTHHAASEG